MNRLLQKVIGQYPFCLSAMKASYEHVLKKNDWSADLVSDQASSVAVRLWIWHSVLRMVSGQSKQQDLTAAYYAINDRALPRNITTIRITESLLATRRSHVEMPQKSRKYLCKWPVHRRTVSEESLSSAPISLSLYYQKWHLHANPKWNMFIL